MTNVERFLEKFGEFGARPCPERYEDLFDPEEGTVLHPGMPAPLHRDHVRAYMTNFLESIPGFGFEIVWWAEREGRVFVEARNRAHPGGRDLEWGSVYRIVLRGDRVLRGQAFTDRVPILAALLPEATLGEIDGIGAPTPSLAQASTAGAGQAISS